MTPPLNPTICPLCGASNDCGMQAGQESCWCFEVAVPKQALEALPLEARGAACVCRGCAEAARAAKERRLPVTR